MTAKTKQSKSDFTSMFEELEKLSESFENGEFPIEEGLERFEHGLLLAEQLKKKLDAVEQKVEKLKTRFEGLRSEKPDTETEEDSE